MVTKAFAGLLSALLLSANGCLMTGCATTPEAQTSYDNAWKRLEAANFQGHVTASTGGPPLSVGAKNVFWLGPEVNFAFDGNVDFTRTPRVGPASDQALTASLPEEQADAMVTYNSLPPNPATVRLLGTIEKFQKREFEHVRNRLDQIDADLQTMKDWDAKFLMAIGPEHFPEIQRTAENR